MSGRGESEGMLGAEPALEGTSVLLVWLPVQLGEPGACWHSACGSRGSQKGGQNVGASKVLIGAPDSAACGSQMISGV